MMGGAVLAAVLVRTTSLSESFWILGTVAVGVALASLAGLRGLDAASRRRSELLAARLAIVEDLPITEGTPQLVLEQLASASQLCPLPPGVDVVLEGTPAHAFYAVVDGQFVVHRNGDTVAHIGPGGSFGERGLLDSAPRNATVTTEQETTVLRIEGDALLEALEQAPVLSSALDRSNGGRPRLDVPADETPLVDDPRWAEAT